MEHQMVMNTECYIFVRIHSKLKTLITINNKLTVYYLKTKLNYCKSTTIIYCYKYTMMSKASHVNRDSSLRNA